jgi:light-regulated signal transduction histidine kinase (bacteriophytochrome)
LAQDLAGVATWDWNIVAGVTHCSPNYFTLYGLPPSDCAPDHEQWLALIHTEGRDRVDAALTAAVELGSEFDTEFRVVWADGTLHWLSGRGKVLFDAGRPVRMLGVNMDVTDRMQVEELRLENAILTRANGELTVFAAAAAHDLQAPLRMIQSYAELLVRREAEHVSPEGREFLSYISDGVARLRGLIDGLLKYARLGKIDPERLSIADLNQCLGLALANLETVRKTTAQITRDDLPHLPVDAGLIVVLFQNLIDNALKYRKPGEPPRVHVSATADREGHYVFSVADNGLGFDLAHAERIFLGFRRLHSREIPGSGLGLANCKRIVLAHGGKIWAESAIGSGAVFRFTLPGSRLLQQATQTR